MNAEETDSVAERSERLLERLEREVRREESVVLRDREAFLKRPLGERIRSGWTLSPVVVRRTASSKWLELRADLRHSRYREGDRLRVHTGVWGDVNGLDVTVAREERDRLWVRPDGNPEDLPGETTTLIADPGYLNLTRYYLHALEECASSHVGRTLVLPMLLGDLHLRLEGHLYDESLDVAEARGLNEAQADAYASCVACSHATYVQGPPGTGKTRVLAEVVRTLVERGERVWVGALSHRAINHALTAVRSVAPHAKLARIADAKNEVPTGIDQYEYLENSPLCDEPGGYAIGATPFLGMTNRLRDWTCDTLLIDEASQVTLPLALMAMLKARRVLLFGDDRQLPPIQVSCPLSECGERGVLQRLPLSDMHTMLTVTYRMHPELCRWPGRRFYGDGLVAHESTRRTAPPFPGRSGRWFRVHSSSIAGEADQVVRTAVRLLTEGGLRPESLAILSPFRAHARRIRAGLRARGVEVRVDTVERMQGQECDVVLFAAGVDHAARVTALGEFLFHPNKLNVAITRARAGVVLFAHPVVLETPLYGDLGKQQEVWRSLFLEAEELRV